MRFEPIKPKPGQPFGQAKVDKLIDEFKRILTETAVAGSNFMMYYPPQTLLKTHYNRKGARGGLQSSWFFESADVEGGKLVSKIASSGSVTPYNIFVEGGKETQGPMFRRAGWQNTDDLGDLASARLMKHCNAAIKNWAKE